jgi:hypothetical protein
MVMQVVHEWIHSISKRASSSMVMQVVHEWLHSISKRVSND